MNQSNTGYLLLCLMCGLPYLAGVLSTVVIMARLGTIGLPWALVPFGGTFKKLWSERND